MNPKPRVVLVAPRTPSSGSAGIEQYILHLSRFLKRKKMGVEIWGTGKKNTHTVHDGIPWREFVGFSPHQSFYFSLGLFNALRKSDADIIHANGFNNLTTLAAALAKKPNQKLVVTLNSSPPSSLVTKLLRPPFEWVFGAIANRLDCIICVSQNEYRVFTQLLSSIPRERFVVIPNGVDQNAFDSVHVKKKANQLLVIGRMVPNKGHARVIRALPFILQKHLSAELHLVGSGPLENELKQLVHDLGLSGKVIFHGNIPMDQRERVVGLLKESTVLVLLSDYEGNPLVLNEALAAKTPAVVSDQGVMHEYVERKDAVGVKDIDNPEKVAEVLSSVLDHPARFIGKRSPETWEEIGNAIWRVYQSLL